MLRDVRGPVDEIWIGLEGIESFDDNASQTQYHILPVAPRLVLVGERPEVLPLPQERGRRSRLAIMAGQPILFTWLARCVSNIPLCPEGRPPWLRTDRLLGEWAIPRDSVAARQQFALHLEARRKAEQTGDLSALPRGWCLGSEQFRQELVLQKLKIAARLRAETTVTLKWITGRLSMGVPGYVSGCLRTAKY